MLAAGGDEHAAAFKAELGRRVAEPRFSRLPTIADAALSAEAEKAHDAYKEQIRALEKVSKAYSEAAEKFKLAQANAINATAAESDAVVTLARSGAWTLHRTADLTLGLDAQKDFVNVAARTARGNEKFDHLDTSLTGTAVETLSGPLLAAVVDEDGRLRSYYTSDEAVDGAFKSWTLRSYRAGGDVVGADADEALTKVRFSHYEEKVDGQKLPVLLGEKYLSERLSGAESALWKAKHWSHLPFNWGNIPLEILRGVTGIPAELAGRDPRQSHYLGRAAMYKTEGGATEHHHFSRRMLGFVDVLNLAPDPAHRFFDPSQFPSVVKTDSAIRPGEGIWSKDLTAKRNGRELDIHLGRQALQRERVYADEDRKTARVRTLSRFQGGVEQLTLETRRGRGGWYQESKRTAELGPEAVSSRLTEGADEVTSATPGHLFVDSVERQVRILPGVDAYGRQAGALDGYAGRVAERGRTIETDRARLEADLARAATALGTTLTERDRARTEQEELRARWHRLAQRIGEQEELEKRITALEAEIKFLENRIAFWDRYLRVLEEARRNPTNPTDPTRPPWPNPMFWAWVLALFFLAAVVMAIIHALRRRVPPRPL
jgi:hypothetical protein